MPRKRTGTTQNEVAAMKNAQLAIEPPEHCDLHEGAERFYNAIIKSRDLSMWNDVDVARAVLLANYQADLKAESATLKKEGSVVINERGTPIMNPRFNIVNTLTRLEISLAKALQTDAASTQGRSRDVSNKNKASREAQDKAKNIGGLIPGIRLVK